MPVSSMISRPMFSVTGTGGRDEPMGLPRTSHCARGDRLGRRACMLIDADVARAFTDVLRALAEAARDRV
jgi:hypothetical protein